MHFFRWVLGQLGGYVDLNVLDCFEALGLGNKRT